MPNDRTENVTESEVKAFNKVGSISKDQLTLKPGKKRTDLRLAIPIDNPARDLVKPANWSEVHSSPFRTVGNHVDLG